MHVTKLSTFSQQLLHLIDECHCCHFISLFICSGVSYQQFVLSIIVFVVLKALCTWLFSVIAHWTFNCVDSSLSPSWEERNIWGVSRYGRRLIEICFCLEHSESAHPVGKHFLESKVLQEDAAKLITNWVVLWLNGKGKKLNRVLTVLGRNFYIISNN